MDSILLGTSGHIVVRGWIGVGVGMASVIDCWAAVSLVCWSRILNKIA